MSRVIYKGSCQPAFEGVQVGGANQLCVACYILFKKDPLGSFSLLPIETLFSLMLTCRPATPGLPAPLLPRGSDWQVLKLFGQFQGGCCTSRRSPPDGAKQMEHPSSSWSAQPIKPEKGQPRRGLSFWEFSTSVFSQNGVCVCVYKNSM